VAFDPDYAKVAALLPMNGTAGSTTFTDVKGNVWTPAGGAQISTAHSFFGSGVGAFDGDARITTPHSDALALATGDFAIEFLVRFTSGGACILVNKALATGLYPYQIWVDGAGAFGFRGFGAGGNLDYSISGGTRALLTDYFISARRSGSTFTLHVNDTLIGSATYAGALRSAAADPLSIGAYSDGAYGFYGYLGQVRITPGVVRPTSYPTEAWPTSAPPLPQAYAAAPTPLGAPATLAASIRQAWAYAASPLGAPAILTASGETFFARAAAATPLGTPLALTRAVGAARVATAGPLGAGAALGQLVAVARAMAVGPLGAPVVMARTTVYAQASAPSPLGDPVVKANLPSVLLQAQGFNSTAFGTPSFATRLQAAGFNSTAFGVPSSPVPQTVVASGFSKTSFGWPFGFQYIQPKINQVVSASPLATTQFGLPSAFIDVTVQAAGSTSGQFGTPTTKLGLGAQAIAPATSWGAPLLLLSMRAQGFGGTSFGVPHAVMVQHAASTYRATRWGLPTCTRSNTYLARSIASTSRFGRPTARKINAYQASSITSTGQFGTPACALRYRALGIHGVARFGKPLLIRSAAC
jgi:hypothetical protein